MEDLRFLGTEMCGLGGEAAADDVVGAGCGGGGVMGGGEAGDERGGELRGVSWGLAKGGGGGLTWTEVDGSWAWMSWS